MDHFFDLHRDVGFGCRWPVCEGYVWALRVVVPSPLDDDLCLWISINRRDEESQLTKRGYPPPGGGLDWGVLAF